MSDVTSNPSRPPSPSASQLAAGDLPTARPYRFVWDPSSRRPGPESVAGTTEGGRYATDYIAGPGQYPLGVLNNPSSMNLALGALPAEWSSAKLGFHAISTVLNNPHKKQAPPKAHSSLPAVPPADLPRVRRKDFDSYLKAIKPEWDKYERNLQLGKEGQAQGFGPIPERDESAEDQDDDTTLPIPHHRSSSNATAPSSPLPVQARVIPPLETVPSIFFEPNFSLGDARTFNAVTEQASLTASATPTQSNMRVGSRISDDDDPADPLSLSHTLPLLEKFDHYADTVEQHLIREISLRSSSFFAALTNLRDLQTSSTACLSRIQNLRQKLNEVDEGTAKKGLELVAVKRKEGRVREVKDGVKMVEGVVEMMGTLKGLVHAGQWGEALGVIEEVEGMWEGQPEAEEPVRTVNGHTPLESMAEEDELEPQNGDSSHNRKPTPPAKTIPLSSLTAFNAVPSHLRSLSMQIAASVSADLVAVLKDDWLSYIEAQESLQKPETAPNPVDSKEDQETDKPVPNGKIPSADGRDPSRDQGLKDHLKPLLMNLLRTKGLKEGILSWKEVVLGELKVLVSKKIPGIDSESDAVSEEARAGLANHLRSLPQDEFMSLMKGVYRSLLNGIERLKAQGDIMTELLDTLRVELSRPSRTPIPPSLSKSRSSGSSSTQSTLPSITEDLADFLYAACELANNSAAKTVSYRSEQHSKLGLPEFLDFFNNSWSFVVRCEVLSRKMIISLRGTVVSQAKLWLQTFHQARISQSAKLVEDEVWNAVAVSSRTQDMVNIIVGSAVQDSPELVVKGSSAEPSVVSNSSQMNGSSPQENGQPSAQLPQTAASATSARPGSSASKHLRIDDKTHFCVSATLEIIVLLVDYLKIVVNLNMLTTETMNRVIEFLKAFNSRTCQVVLGAGAMRSAGLKNITAKHLALASQSLSVVFELIPYVRETFRRHLSSRQAVMLVEFDKLKRVYQEHQNEIHAKLIAIMGDRLSIHIKALQAIDWSTPNPGVPVNSYMVELVKETTMLHKVLSRYLPQSLVEYVMSEVLAAINHRLSEEYGKIDLPDQAAKDRLLEDAKYLKQQFSSLRNVRAPMSMLETVVTEMTLHRPGGNPVPPTPTVPQTPSRSNTLSTNQRLRGLLSGNRASTLLSGALPTPSSAQTPTPPMPPPADTKPPLLSPSTGASSGSSQGNGQIVLGGQGSISASTISLASTSPSREASARPSNEASRTSESGPQSVPNGDSRSDVHTSPPLPPKPDAGGS